MLDGLNLFGGLRTLRPGQIGAWMADLADFGIQPIRWVTGSERSDSFVRDHLSPALWECAMLLKTLGEKRKRKRNPGLSRRRTEQIARI